MCTSYGCVVVCTTYVNSEPPSCLLGDAGESDYGAATGSLPAVLHPRR